MILVILGVCVVLFVAGYIGEKIAYGDDLCIGMEVIGGFGAGISLLVAIFLAVSVSFSGTIDEKISMYTEENAKIEVAVEKYMDHESETFAAASSNSAITLVSLYPELKSDTLISSQIDVYVKNNAKIVELQESKINASVARWWLYFGK